MFYWTPSFEITMFIFPSSSLLLKGPTLKFSLSNRENLHFKRMMWPRRSHGSSRDLSEAL